MIAIVNVTPGQEPATYELRINRGVVTRFGANPRHGLAAVLEAASQASLEVEKQKSLSPHLTGE